MTNGLANVNPPQLPLQVSNLAAIFANISHSNTSPDVGLAELMNGFKAYADADSDLHPSNKELRKEAAANRLQEVSNFRDQQFNLRQSLIALTKRITAFSDSSGKLSRRNPEKYDEEVSKLSELAATFDPNVKAEQETLDEFAKLQKACEKLSKESEAKKEERARANAQSPSDEEGSVERDRRDEEDQTKEGLIKEIDSQFYQPADDFSAYVDGFIRKNPFITVIWDPFRLLHISVDKYLGLYNKYFADPNNQPNQEQLNELNALVEGEIFQQLIACRPVVDLGKQAKNFFLPEGRGEIIEGTYQNYNNTEIATDEQQDLYIALGNAIDGTADGASLEKLQAYAEAYGNMQPFLLKNLETLLAIVVKTTTSTLTSSTSSTTTTSTTDNTVDSKTAAGLQYGVALGIPALGMALYGLSSLIKRIRGGVNREEGQGLELRERLLDVTVDDVPGLAEASFGPDNMLQAGAAPGIQPVEPASRNGRPSELANPAINNWVGRDDSESQGLSAETADHQGSAAIPVVSPEQVTLVEQFVKDGKGGAARARLIHLYSFTTTHSPLAI